MNIVKQQKIVSATTDIIRRKLSVEQDSVTKQLVFRLASEELNEFCNVLDVTLSADEHSNLMNLIAKEIESEFVSIKFKELDAAESQITRYEKITIEDINKAPYYWEKFSSYKKISRSSGFVTALNKDVNRILRMMPSPTRNDSFKSFGMVIGDVQAGKTGNYSGLINKAADLGYKFIIVLTGMTESLRQQTQKRLDDDFIGATSEAGKKLNSRRPVGVGRMLPHEPSKVPMSMTDQKSDFPKNAPRNYNLESVNSPVVIVTKKETNGLSTIIKFLEGQGYGASRRNIIPFPTLIIDDESDNASVDTSKDGEDPKAINKKIRILVALCKKVAYVAYTATPYANIFIDPEASSSVSVDNQQNDHKIDIVDLYPQDFIVALNAPSNYCGGDFFYSDNPDIENSSAVKRFIFDAEQHFPLNHKKNWSVSALPQSLKEAIHEFYIAVAIKSIRRKKGVIAKFDKHDSMLINVSRFTAYQNEVSKLVSDYTQNKINDGLFLDPNDHNSRNVWSILKAQYENHYSNIIKDDISWEDIVSELIELSSEGEHFIKVVTIHGESEDNLEYFDEPNRYIAIGGFKLSRGLTLDGLVVSYFYRRSIMYDTLMQMARWFGYRDGYRDLVRLYTSRECATWYEQISSATAELKKYLVDMERQKKEPRDFGVKVRTTEAALIVTAQNKMRSTEALKLSQDFSNTSYETFYVDPRLESNNSNKKVTQSFVSNFASQFKALTSNDYGNGYIARNLLSRDVLHFLTEFSFHPANRWAIDNALLQFIEDNSENLYEHWDVGLQSIEQGDSTEEYKITDSLIIKASNRTTNLTRNSTVKRESIKKENTYKLPLGHNSRLSAGATGRFGISKGNFERYMSENTAKNDGVTKKSITDLDAIKYRSSKKENPLLLIQATSINITLEEQGGKNKPLSELQKEKAFLDPLVSENPYYITLYILLPSVPNVTPKTYVANKNYLKEAYGELEQDD